MIDLTGRKIGRLVVVSEANRDRNAKRRWLCRCECGADTIVYQSQLTVIVKKRPGMGCMHCRIGCGFEPKHKMYGSPTYRSWQSMLQRCLNPNDPSSANYGGRGVAVCDRWRSFENFLADMGERPAGHTLDRVDNDGNYGPDNCRWATVHIQNQNRSITKITPEIARDIRARAAAGQSRKGIAKTVGLSACHVSHIVLGRAWSNVQ